MGYLMNKQVGEGNSGQQTKAVVSTSTPSPTLPSNRQAEGFV